MISCDRLALLRLRPIGPRWRLGGGDCKDQPTSADSLLELVRNYTILSLLMVWFDGISILLLEVLVRSIASSLTNRQEPEWHFTSGRWPASKVRFPLLDHQIELKGHRVEKRSYRTGMGFDSDLTDGHTGSDVYKRTLPRGAPVLLSTSFQIFEPLLSRQFCLSGLSLQSFILQVFRTSHCLSPTKCHMTTALVSALSRSISIERLSTPT